MRSTIVMMLLAFLSISRTQAQAYSYVAFPDSNAQWNYFGVIHPMGGTVNLYWNCSYNGDTSINNVIYHILSGNASGFLRNDHFKRTYFHYSSLSWYSSPYYDTIDHPIYDFSLGVGDTMIDSFLYSGYYTPYNTVIDSIDTILINSAYRRKFFVSTNGISNAWIEGIGSINFCVVSYIFGSEYPMNLCRFVESDSIIYQGCYPLGITGVQAITANIYPNPIQDYVLIDCQDYNGLLSMACYNSIGQRLDAKNFIAQLKLDLSNYPSGVYFLQITNEDGQSLAKKIVKQ